MATHSSILAWRGFTWWLRDKEICLQCRRPGFDPWVRKIPWRREWQPSPVFLPGESQGQRILEGYGPQGCKESDMTEQLSTLFHTPHFYSKQCKHQMYIFHCYYSNQKQMRVWTSIKQPWERKSLMVIYCLACSYRTAPSSPWCLGIFEWLKATVLHQG